MITASHNPECDNGLKLVDPSGEMLEAAWEKIATDLVNIDEKDLISTLHKIIKEQEINETSPATIILGRDTRKSSPQLAEATIKGINACNATLRDFGIVTTPQLHYLVVAINTNGFYGDPSLAGYYQKISSAFKNIRGNKINNAKYFAELQLDAANGVGALAMKEFQKYLNGFLTVDIYNNGSGQLNHMVSFIPNSSLSILSNKKLLID